jgi:hypothetical protein
MSESTWARKTVPRRGKRAAGAVSEREGSVASKGSSLHKWGVFTGLGGIVGIGLGLGVGIIVGTALGCVGKGDGTGVGDEVGLKVGMGEGAGEG